ncbi:MAG: indolepyruvate ferredoxin oxidoreductase subunit alpha [Bacillota bacterium]|nr:indolepyruvate ferredoxin oxidoreductase subunit alpha [Bacillota bacterium]
MKKLMTGNEAVARGAYEAGVSFASAYPGTPSTEILENIALYKDDIIAEWAPNEKVALESVIGASVAGVRAIASMKHVGINVAADPLFTFAYTGVTGGTVIVTADEPSMFSSQNEQDNRNYGPFARIPILEPSDSQEAKDMVIEGIRLSEKYDVPVLLRLTTRICHSKTLVELGEREEVRIIDYKKQFSKYVAVPAVSRKLRVKLEQKLIDLEKYSNNSEFNKEEYNGLEIGIVSSGISYQYAKEVFGLNASYFKVGMSYPLPIDKIREFSKKVKKLYVIEELDPFIEERLKLNDIECIGKELLPNIGELSVEIIKEKLLDEKNQTIKYDNSLVSERLPTLCAGCPHRSFFYRLIKRKNIMVTGDIGCYGLGAIEPLNAIDTVICMGASISMGHGAQKVFTKYNKNLRNVSVIGDSTFFHTGINSLLNVVYNKSNPIVCILDNRITAMTGHQNNPGTGITVHNEISTRIEIEEVVRSLGIKNIEVVNPLDFKEMDRAFDNAFGKDEVTVIITKWPCVLKKYSDEDILEFGKNFRSLVVDEDKCIGCKQCLNTGCPALIFDNEKRVVEIDEKQCVGCGVCVQVCPVDAIKEVGDNNNE